MAEPRPGTKEFSRRAKERRDANRRRIVTRRKTKGGVTLEELFEAISNVGGPDLQIRGPVFRPVEAALKGAERFGARKKKRKKK